MSKRYEKPIYRFRNVSFRSDEVALYHRSRFVRFDLFGSLCGCVLDRCPLPTITCNKCCYAYTTNTN